MTSFWVLAATLLLAGYGFFLPTLLGQKSAAGVDRARLNWLINRQKREELAAETGDDQAAERLGEEFDRDLLADLAAAETGPRRQPPEAGKTAVIVVLTALPLAILALYGGLGRMDLVARPATVAAAEPAMAAGDLQARIEQLSRRLQQQPNDLDGWLLLGRSLLAVQQTDKAVQAYEFALKLAPGNPDVEALYAQALGEANQGSLAGKPTEIIEGVLQRNPDHMHSLWLAGLAAVEREDKPKALEYWKKLRSLLPPDGEQTRQLDGYIAELAGTAPPQARADTAPAAAGAGKSIRVKVTLDNKLKGQAGPDDVVFVFARAADGPPMPLAISRKKVSDLPAEITLNDGMAMAPGMKLSSFPRIVIGARVSKTGNAMPSPGDLQGLTSPVEAQDGGTYSVEIGQVVN
ncbi:c-type cytochrome biogenesis protein CcmI [Methylococcus capsulatus]|uniref:Cytochrome c-type biogenesis protein CcmH n=1 Tax=Methylococcus capsulatus TaxID=414 RepID=A0AA35UJH5_METCP|nr:c-type cytochrome biogenesis protein CcmI [Methylococcus capsulatus]CAI8767456.1 cytochrome c-type biogenesis protein CcmH [Methylococcus capsulatus]